MNNNTPLPRAFQSIRMLDENTVEVVYRENQVVTNQDVDEIYSAYDQFTEGKRLKKLMIIGKKVDISSETRFKIINNNNQRKDLIIAEAVVVHSTPQKLKVNFYIMFLKKIYPIQYFTDIEAAKEWLKQF